MKIVKYFVLIVLLFISIAVFGVHFYLERSISQIETNQQLSSLDSYLAEKYSLTLNLDKKVEDVVALFCEDKNGDTSSSSITYDCQNKNPVHKIIIGSASNDQSFEDIVKSIGNQELFWKNAVSEGSENGRMICKEWAEVKGYNNVTGGVNCFSVSDDGTKLYSSIVFLNSKIYKQGKVFIAVVNTLQTSSQEKTETEIVALLRNQKISNVERVIKFFSFLGAKAPHINSVLEVSSDNTLESLKNDSSNSSSFATLVSGDGIDGEVCDASKTSSCYPIYCNSPTAVWGKSISKCVEPIAPKKEAVDGGLCLGDLPVWDGSKCKALVGNIISSNFCLVELGENSCKMKLMWSVASSQKKVEVKYLGKEETLLSNATSGSLMYSFSFDADPQTVGLFDGDKKISEGKFITKCKSGSFDDISKTCVDPEVLGAYVDAGHVENLGTIIFTCNASNAYTVKSLDNNTIVATGTYTQEVKVPVTTSGSYSIFCSKGNVDSSPVARYFNATVPPPVVSLSLSPQFVPSSGTTTIAWNILRPRSECKLTAKVYCKSTGCTPEQSSAEGILNAILETEDSEQGAQSKPINIQDSLKNVSENSPTGEARALGKKTVPISQTTDFILSCGNGAEITKRIYTEKKQKVEEQ